MAYTFDNPEAEDRHTTQYFEMFGNRGIYHEGWTAVTHHSSPWIVGNLPSFDEDEWELYDTTKDWSQAHDLSKEMPEKLREAFAFETDAAKQKDLAAQVQARAMDVVSYVPIGQYTYPIAYRDSIEGVIKGPIPFFWNVKRK